MLGPDSALPLFIGLFVLVIGGMIWLAIRQARKTRERRAALIARVTACGYSYAGEDPARTSMFTSAPFGLGDSRRARDLVWGTVSGRPFETFAYLYETHTTDSKGNRTTTTHRHQITWIPLPGGLPIMRLTADNAMMRLFSKMGAKDLDVESHEFNQRWKVWCADERTGHAGRSIVFEGSLLMTYVTGHTDLGDLEQIVASLYGVSDGIPAFLWEARG